MRIAIGQVKVDHPHALHVAFNEPRLFVLRIAGQALLDLGQVFALGEDGDAVETFLAVPDRPVTDLLELGRREAVVLTLDLLQAGDRGTGFLEPFEQARQARLCAIDVEGCDAHPAGSRCRSWNRNRNRPPRWDFRP
jgi:hypothetical protein